MDIINHQSILIDQLFKMLGMKDVIKEFDIITPFNLSSSIVEFAPYDIILEDPCPFGNKCLYKKTPLLCSKNHQTKIKILKKQEIIPKYLCKYERPWKTLNNKPMRCQNIYCWFSHLEGRKEFITCKHILSDMNINFELFK